MEKSSILKSAIEATKKVTRKGMINEQSEILARGIENPNIQKEDNQR